MLQYKDLKDYEAIKRLLTEDPSQANAGIGFDDNNMTPAHPLHRICDGVFNNLLSEEEALALAQLYLEHGADINGFAGKGQETPLIAAASLHAEKLGILYIEKGADIHFVGFMGATALHWASWTGRDKLVQRLIKEKAAINRQCTQHKSTPLGWAVHGYKFGGIKNRHHQVDCVKLLLQAGADKTIPNIEGVLPIQFLTEEDEEMLRLLK